MEVVSNWFFSWGWAVIILAIVIPLSKTIFGWVIIGDNFNGLVIKKWGFGPSSRLPEGQIIARNGEAGIQAQMLGPGLHWFYWWFMYKVEKIEVTTVEENHIGMIEALDGAKLPAGSILAAKVVDCDSFQDAKKFLDDGGQKGWQRNYLTNGKYRINSGLFKITIVPAVYIESDEIGLVTTLDGQQLPQKSIAGKKITGHKTFQDADAFLNSGGCRGLQEEVLLPGKYYINPKFVNITKEAMMRVEVGHVGVVNSFIGEEGEDISGADFKHGNIVKEGQKGIWEKTLDPGLYPINKALQEVLLVPTTNIVLNWKNETTETHGLDKGLKTITVRSIDGFTFDMEVSQIINISSESAPKVIARFGTIENLIAQVLQPTVGNYFRNSAQTSEALSFVEGRSERQEEARKYITEVLEKYDVVCVDTLIGDINPPQELMKILADRKIAEQEQEMFEKQKASEEKRQEYVKAKTAANKEEQLTSSRYDKDIATQKALELVEETKGKKDSAVIAADGDAYVLTTVGKAKSENIKMIGTAESDVIKLKTDAMGQDKFALVQIAEHLSKNNIKLVPEILVQGNTGQDGGILSALIGNELLKKSMVPDNNGERKEATKLNDQTKPTDQETNKDNNEDTK